MFPYNNSYHNWKSVFLPLCLNGATILRNIRLWDDFNIWVKFAKFDDVVVDLWSVMFGGFEDFKDLNLEKQDIFLAIILFI